MKNTKCFLRMPEELSKQYKFSKYNLYIDETRRVVYNTITQAVSEFDDKEIKQNDIKALLECGFLVRNDKDEFPMLEEEYRHRDKLSNELHLIIALTLDCQFRCVYCYENHPKHYMKEMAKEGIVSLVSNYASQGRNISIVWYGGEPMLDFVSIKQMTKLFMDICLQYKVDYSATMISNGYLFDDTNIEQLDELGIEAIQITLDGMKPVHEMRRPMSNGEESFDRIIDNIVNIYANSNVLVHLRINVDKENIQSAYDLVEYCANLGLMDIDINLGMLKAFGCDNSCSSLANNLFTMKEFAFEFIKFKEHLKRLGFEKAIEKMEPEYKVNSCMMCICQLNFTPKSNSKRVHMLPTFMEACGLVLF